MSQEEVRSNRNYRNVRAVMHLGMGGIYVLFGAIIATYKIFLTKELSPAMAYGLGGLLGVYGIFRLYRGFADLREMRRERRRPNS